MTDAAHTGPDAAPAPTGGRDHRHLIGLSAGVVALFVVLRIITVAQWHWETAWALTEAVEIGNAAEMVLGTLYAAPWLTGAVLALVTPLVALRVLFPDPDTSERRFEHLVLLAVCVAFFGSLLVSHDVGWLLVASLAVLGVLLVVRRVAHTGPVRRAFGFVERHVGAVVVLGALALAGTVSTPWMEHERITLDTGDEVSGYVIDAPSGFLKVLTDDREIRFLLWNHVEHRELTH